MGTGISGLLPDLSAAARYQSPFAVVDETFSLSTEKATSLAVDIHLKPDRRHFPGLVPGLAHPAFDGDNLLAAYSCVFLSIRYVCVMPGS